MWDSSAWISAGRCIIVVPSRHLGLLQPDEMQKQRDWVETVAEAARKTIDIDGILEIAAQAEMLQIQKATGETEKASSQPVIALAWQETRHFPFIIGRICAC